MDGRAGVVVWVLRGGWLLLPLALGPAVGQALDGRRTSLEFTALVLLWAAWAVGLVATLVPSTPSLTTVRLLVPLGVVAAVLAALFGAETWSTALAVVVTVVVTVVAMSAEVGLAFVQASAYGDERRYPLRLPVAVLVGPVPLAWALMTGPIVAGLLLLGAGQPIWAVVFLAIGAALAAVLSRRFHRLALRFIVLVPTGFVVHDPLLLADTAMFRQPQIAHLGLAGPGTDATDLTGRAPDPPLEVQLREPSQVVVAGTLQARQGRTVPVSAFLVAPSRPGRLLTEASRRGYPVAGAAARPDPST